MKVAIVVLDPDGIWQPVWGDLYRDVAPPYFAAILRTALERYPQLVSKWAGYQDAEIAGAKLVQRYLDGDRGVFARRLAASIGPESVNRITELYRDNPRFHDAAESYMGEFEGMLARAREHKAVAGSNLFADILSAERESGTRVIAANE